MSWCICPGHRRRRRPQGRPVFTPLGYETIDPSTNPFYSHSYIFQFGLPFKHTGALTATHVNRRLDVYAGIDTGTNTTFGPLGDNNGAVGGIGGSAST